MCQPSFLRRGRRFLADISGHAPRYRTHPLSPRLLVIRATIGGGARNAMWGRSFSEAPRGICTTRRIEKKATRRNMRLLTPLPRRAAEHAQVLLLHAQLHLQCPAQGTAGAARSVAVPLCAAAPPSNGPCNIHPGALDPALSGFCDNSLTPTCLCQQNQAEWAVQGQAQARVPVGSPWSGGTARG
jgi:hypothetical protein